MKTITKQNTAVLNSNIIYRCKDITLANFVTCVCDHNLDVLVVSGEATEEEKTTAFEKLYEEYCTLTGNPTFSYQVILIKRIMLLELKELVAYSALKTGDLSLLRRAGYKPENLDAKLSRDTFNHKQALNELRKIQKNSTAPVDRQSFVKWYTRLSKHVGYRIDPKTTYLDEFIAIDKDYRDQSNKTL